MIRFIVRDSWGASVIDGPHQQAYMFVTKPYIPVTMRLNAPPGSTAEFTGRSLTTAGLAAGASRSTAAPAQPSHGTTATRTRLEPISTMASSLMARPTSARFHALGYAMEYDSRVVAAVKLDVWMAPSNLEGDPSPYPSVNDFYVLRRHPRRRSGADRRDRPARRRGRLDLLHYVSNRSHGETDEVPADEVHEL